MHLAVDCRSVHYRMGGIGRAALELVQELAVQSRAHHITMIVGSGQTQELTVKGAHILPVDAAMIDERFEQWELPSLLEDLAPDVYLNTTFSVPAIKTTRAQVAIIHDVVFEDEPEYVEPGLRSYLSRWSRFSAGHADHVLTVSDHARERIQAVYGVSSSKITRVYNGIAPSCFVRPEDSETERVRRKFGLERPFILYLGTLEIKKGILQLLRAYRQAADLGVTEPLVLAGGKGAYGLDLEAEIRNVGCVGRILPLGFVDEADKKPLLSASSLFVYPSLYEGFGIPPLEAMALGIPSVVSNLTSLPEVVGDAALIARVQEPGHFAQALIRGLRDTDFRKEAQGRGPARARKFTWEKSASQVLEICERLGMN